ncbi:BRO-A [Choristoneura occidentalis alphabaculovirus]|nr:BRO-A [Choristoneura occidentalis alphabaculovirus]
MAQVWPVWRVLERISVPTWSIMDRNIKKMPDTWIFKMCTHYTGTGIHHPCLSNSFVKRPVYLQRTQC